MPVEGQGHIDLKVFCGAWREVRCMGIIKGGQGVYIKLKDILAVTLLVLGYLGGESLDQQARGQRRPLCH